MVQTAAIPNLDTTTTPETGQTRDSLATLKTGSNPFELDQHLKGRASLNGEQATAETRQAAIQALNSLASIDPELKEALGDINLNSGSPADLRNAVRAVQELGDRDGHDLGLSGKDGYLGPKTNLIIQARAKAAGERIRNGDPETESEVVRVKNSNRQEFRRGGTFLTSPKVTNLEAQGIAMQPEGFFLPENNGQPAFVKTALPNMFARGKAPEAMKPTNDQELGKAEQLLKENKIEFGQIHRESKAADVLVTSSILEKYTEPADQTAFNNLINNADSVDMDRLEKVLIKLTNLQNQTSDTAVKSQMKIAFNTIHQAQFHRNFIDSQQENIDNYNNSEPRDPDTTKRVGAVTIVTGEEVNTDGVNNPETATEIVNVAHSTEEVVTTPGSTLGVDLSDQQILDKIISLGVKQNERTIYENLGNGDPAEALALLHAAYTMVGEDVSSQDLKKASDVLEEIWQTYGITFTGGNDGELGAKIFDVSTQLCRLSKAGNAATTPEKNAHSSTMDETEVVSITPVTRKADLPPTERVDWEKFNKDHPPYEEIISDEDLAEMRNVQTGHTDIVTYKKQLDIVKAELDLELAKINLEMKEIENEELLLLLEQREMDLAERKIEVEEAYADLEKKQIGTEHKKADVEGVWARGQETMKQAKEMGETAEDITDDVVDTLENFKDMLEVFKVGFPEKVSTHS